MDPSHYLVLVPLAVVGVLASLVQRVVLSKQPFVHTVVVGRYMGTEICGKVSRGVMDDHIIFLGNTESRDVEEISDHLPLDVDVQL